MKLTPENLAKLSAHDRRELEKFADFLGRRSSGRCVKAHRLGFVVRASDRNDYIRSTPFDMSHTPVADRRVGLALLAHHPEFHSYFGSPSFRFRNEFLYDAWALEFEGGLFWIFTNRTRGTCYETTCENTATRLRFLEAVAKLLDPSA